MKKTIVIVGIVLGSLLFSACTSSAFKKAKDTNTIAGYDRFIKKYYDEPKYVYKAKMLRKQLLSPKQREFEYSNSLIRIKVVNQSTKEENAGNIGNVVDRLFINRNRVITKKEFIVKITSNAKYNKIKGEVNFISEIEKIVSDEHTLFGFSIFGHVGRTADIQVKEYTTSYKFNLLPEESIYVKVPLGSLVRSSQNELNYKSDTSSKLKKFYTRVYSSFN